MLLKNGTVLFGENLDVVKKDIRLQGSLITDVADNIVPCAGEDVFDATNKLIAPGFINAHFHPTHSISKGMIDGYNWETGLSVLYHVDVAKSDEDRYWTSLLGFAENTLSGVTSSVVLTSNIVGEARAAKELGIRVFLGKSYSDIYLREGPAPRMMTAEEIQAEFEKMRKNFRSDLIDVYFGLSSDLGVSDKLLALSREMAEKHDTKIQIHSSEMRSMVRAFTDGRGKHPILHYKDIGFLCDRVMLVHMTQIDRADVMDALQASGAQIVHCPVANAKLSDGILPLRALRQRGINIAFGTDADINNNSSNILSDVKVGALLHGSHQHRADAVTAVEMLKMVTVNGAKAMGRNDVGMIDKGKIADVAIFDMNTPAFTPSYDVRSNLVFNAPDIRPEFVMVNGSFVVENYMLRNVDIRQVMDNVNVIARKIKENLRDAPKPRTHKKVYVSGSLTGVEDPTLKTFYEDIANVAKDCGMEAYVAHMHGTDPVKNPDVAPEEVYEKDIDHVLEADITIAYVGAKSIGTGMELMLAKMHQRDIILLYEKDAVVTRLAKGAVHPHNHIVFDHRGDALEKLREKLQSMLK